MGLLELGGESRICQLERYQSRKGYLLFGHLHR